MLVYFHSKYIFGPKTNCQIFSNKLKYTFILLSSLHHRANVPVTAAISTCIFVCAEYRNKHILSYHLNEECGDADSNRGNPGALPMVGRLGPIDPPPFLAPPAERQRSFSNADSSVVVVRRPSSSSSSVVNFSIKSLISQKLSDNFFSFFGM